MNNNSIEELFQYSNDLIQEKREEIDKDLASKIKNIEHNLEKLGLVEKSGAWYTKRIEANLNAFEDFIRFRVKSDLMNFPVAKTEMVYEKIYERATAGLKGRYPFGIPNIIEEMKRNKAEAELLNSTEKRLQGKMIYLDSLVKREIRKDKTREQFNKSFEKDNYKLIKKIADDLDQINILFNKRYGSTEGLFNYWEYKFWFEINKPCLTKDDFKNHIEYLSNLVNGIGKAQIEKIIGKIKDEHDQNPRSISYLEKLLQDKFSDKDSENIISCFRGILKIRANLVHKEGRDIVKALNRFKLDYPIKDYQFAFNIIINTFANQISELNEIFDSK